MTINPIQEYSRWLDDFGGNTSRSATNIIARQMRKDSIGRADGSKRFRGSLIGDPCDRKVVLSYTGAPQGYTELKYATSGSWAHYKWQACGLTLGWLTDIEVPVRHGRFKGSIDGIMADGRIFELKTTRSTVLRNLKEPKDQALDQVNLYMYAAGIKEACMVYEGREDLFHKKFDLEIDMDRVSNIIERTNRLYTEIKKKRLPEMHPLCTPNSVMRNYCSFQEECLARWSDE